MKEIKRIIPASLAKVFGALYGLLGLIAGFIFLIISLIAVVSGHPGGLFGFIAVVLIPLIYGVLGLVLGYLMALLYNFVAKKVGGIKFEIE
jgi:hypothetical protein